MLNDKFKGVFAVKNPGPEDPAFEQARHRGARASPPWSCKFEAQYTQKPNVGYEICADIRLFTDGFYLTSHIPHPTS
jgi:hypothetical protein